MHFVQDTYWDGVPHEVTHSKDYNTLYWNDCGDFTTSAEGVRDFRAAEQRTIFKCLRSKRSDSAAKTVAMSAWPGTVR